MFHSPTSSFLASFSSSPRRYGFSLFSSSALISPPSLLLHPRRYLSSPPPPHQAPPTMATPAFLALSVLALASLAASQAPAAGPTAPDCSSALTSLAGCLTYIQPGSPQSKPPKECCAGVKAAVATPASVKCLCDALHTDYGVPLNMTRAAALPAACGASAAAFSTCNIKLPGAPGAAPTEAPSPSSGSTPATGSPGPAKSAATRSPVSVATLVLAALVAPLSYYYL